MEKIMAKKPSGKQNGKISQVIGAVVDLKQLFLFIEMHQNM
jgi:hypothetical protein